MKIVIATNHTYPPQRVGGSESSMHGICVALCKQGFDVAVLAKWSVRQPSAWTYFRSAAGQPHFRLVRDDPFGYPVYRARDPATAITELVNDLGPDIAVVNSGQPMRLAQQFTSLGVPTIVYFRDTLFQDLGGPVRQSSNLQFVTTSQALAQRVEQKFGVRPICIPPIIVPELYQVEPTRRNVTFVCPVPAKGLDIALKLATQRPDVPFVFQESWPINMARRFVRYLQIRQYENVVLRSQTQDMRTVYREAKVALIPSPSFEGWGRVASEAQVSAIPVLASNVGGLPEAVGDGGILVDPSSDIGTWASALARLWDDPAEYDRISDLALNHSQRPEFTKEALAERLISVISELLLAT